MRSDAGGLQVWQLLELTAIRDRWQDSKIVRDIERAWPRYPPARRKKFEPRVSESWFRLVVSKVAPHDRDLEQLEKEPREAKRGLWSDPHAIAPWEFRKLQRSPTESQIQFSIEVTANVDSPLKFRVVTMKNSKYFLSQHTLGFFESFVLKKKAW